MPKIHNLTYKSSLPKMKAVERRLYRNSREVSGRTKLNSPVETRNIQRGKGLGKFCVINSDQVLI